MDRNALRSFTYGLYLVTTVDAKGHRAGCVVNTAAQVSSQPYRVLVTLNNDNVTCGAIRESGRFAISVLSKSATMDLIGNFGFYSSDNRDKFAALSDVRELDGLPCVADGSMALLECKVISEADAGTHRVFVADVCDAQVLDLDGEPLTYEYYHRVLKGTTPPKASAFVAQDSVMDESAEKQSARSVHHFKCSLCGYVFETEDEELPDDFKCPLCGAGTSMFKKID